MESLLDVALTNAAVATGLALLAAAAGRLKWHPAVVHVLWLLVLAKLLAPPVLELAVVPRPVAEASTPAFTAAPVLLEAASPAEPSSPPGVAGNGAPAGPTPAPWLWLWWAGSLLLAALAFTRLASFGRAARCSRPADETLRRRARHLAVEIGLARCPEVRTIHGTVPPLVWSALSAPRIFLSRDLIRGLTPKELDTVLAHELAHVKRRDHWVRPLELAACLLFWWHPVVWWARRSLRHAEELCCDEWVLRVLPGSARAYADGLLKTIELTARRPSLPVLTSSIWPAGSRSRSESFQRIRERLTMIMKHPEARSPWPLHRLLLALGTCLALVIFPTWAEDPGDGDLEAERSHQRLELERQALELEEKQRALEARELAERLSLHEETTRLRIEEAMREAEALATAGEHSEAERMKQEIEVAQQRALLEAKRFELARSHLMARGELEGEARQAMLEARALAIEGQEGEAEDARRRAEELHLALEQRALEMTGRERQLESEHREAQLAALEAERRRLENAGEAEEAERLAHEAARLRIETRHSAAEHELRQKHQALELERRRLETDLRRREAMTRAEVEVQRRELEDRLREMERERMRHAVEVEMAQVRTEVPFRLRELRRMLEEIDEDGELGKKLDELEAALERALAEGAEPGSGP